MATVRSWGRRVMLDHDGSALNGFNQAGIDIPINVLELITLMIGGEFTLSIKRTAKGGGTHRG